MQINNDDIKLIDRYLLGYLNSQELEQFKERIATDPAFRNLLNEETRLRQGIEYTTLKHMAIQLEQLETSLEETAATETSKLRRLQPNNFSILKIAASVLILIGLSFVIYFFYGRPDFDADLAFKEYFSPYPNEVYSIKRGESDLQSNEERAFYYYEKGDYRTATEYFSKLGKKDEAIIFYEANALMGLNKIEEAKKSFEILVQDENATFFIAAKWYLGLCYLKTNEISKAIALLEYLKQTNTSYRQKAADLLQEINS